MTTSRLVLFDFDGLLADTEPAHMQAYDDVFGLLGIPAKSQPAQWVGRCTKDILEDVIRETGTTIPLEHIRSEKRKLLLKRLHESPLMPGAFDVLQRLSPFATLAIVTSSSMAEIDPIMTRHRLHPFFSFRVCFDDVTRVKPFPDPYLAALAKTSLAASNVLALEDSQKGIESAKAAGIFSIAVPNVFTRSQDFSLADYVADDLLDAEEFMMSKWDLKAE